MPGRSVTVELTEEQAALLDEIAAGQQIAPEKLLLEAVAHGLAMIVAGVDETDLEDPEPPGGVFHSVFPPKPASRPRQPTGRGDLDDDIPF